MSRWVKSWMVTSSTGSRKYKVSYGQSGEWGCSCPAWKFRREQCKHIREIINQVGRNPSVSESPYQKPMYVLTDDVDYPRYDERTNELRIPKRYPDKRTDQDWLETHICNMMLENGYSIREVRSIRGLDDTWTTKKIEADFKAMGEYTGDLPAVSKRPTKKKSNGKVRELMVLGD